MYCVYLVKKNNLLFFVYIIMETTEINIKSENLLNNYNNNETEILEFQLKIAKQKAELEQLDLYIAIKENEEKMRLLQKQNEEFKDNVKNQMLDNWLKSLETFTHKITIKWTMWSLKIEDGSLIPQEYIKEVKPIFDNAKIKSDIKNWKNIPWCSVLEWRSLVITEK